MKIFSSLLKMPGYLAFWITADIVYISLLMSFFNTAIPFTFSEFFFVHILAIAVGSMVMFSGIGAGVLWIPVLTFLDVRPSEAVSISIFTQIAGKGTGSLTYLFNGMVDTKLAVRFIPMALIGVTLGFIAGFFIPLEYEQILLYIFLLVAGYLLMKTIHSLNDDDSEKEMDLDNFSIKNSYPVVILSSFFTGLLSIGNTDWLIPHMEHKLNMPTSRAVANGLFIMFATILFFLFLVCIGVFLGYTAWPEKTPLLFATCSGVITGGQIGTRLIRIPWFKKYQQHAFILMLAMSIVHLLW